MMKQCRIILLAILLCLILPLSGSSQVPPSHNLASGFVNWKFTVDDIEREALVYLPPAAQTANTAVVFVFHGHGGNSRNAQRTFAMNEYWPEAISIYMQGLNTPGRLTDPDGKKAGWQSRAGDQGDRDLKFFDALLVRLKREYKVDEKRIFATGHSNGGGFTYLLWAQRGEVFAAFAPSAAAAPLRLADNLKPKPVMHLAGEKDPLVKFEWQKLTMATVRKINNCDATGKPWDDQCTLYASKSGTPLVTHIQPGGHEFHREAAPLIVKFFKAQTAATK